MKKTMSFAAIHFTVAFHLHEKAWRRRERRLAGTALLDA